MESSLTPILISQRLFGCQTFYKPCGGFIRNTWFIFVTSLLGCVCLFRSVKQLYVIQSSVQDDNFEAATMGAIPFIRFFCLFLSITPIFNIKLFYVKNTSQVFNFVSKYVKKCKSITKLNKDLKRFLYVVFFIFWGIIMSFLAQDIFIWGNEKDVKGERELTIIFRALHALMEEEMITIVWIQEQLFVYMNKEIQCMTFKPMLTNRLEELRIQHGDLCNHSDEICKVYNAHLLFSWAVNLMDMTESVYYILVASLNLGYTFSDAQVKVKVIAGCAWWIVVMYLRLVHLTSVCSGVNKEAHKTSFVLQKLEFSTQQKNILEEIRLFQRQLLHTPIRYSIYNSIPLDSSFISTITSVIISYTLVLVQFHTIQHSEPCHQHIDNRTEQDFVMSQNTTMLSVNSINQETF